MLLLALVAVEAAEGHPTVALVEEGVGADHCSTVKEAVEVVQQKVVLDLGLVLPWEVEVGEYSQAGQDVDLVVAVEEAVQRIALVREEFSVEVEVEPHWLAEWHALSDSP